jgi:hydroxypyruvate isomerase
MDTHGLTFDVNCSILFTELPLLERPAAAAAAGFDAVEFWWPFGDSPVPTDREADAFLGAIADAGVALAGLNFAAGDLAEGHRGWLSLPAKSAAFRDNIQACVGIADRAGCRVLNALYGNRVDGVAEAEQDELATENLTLAAQAAAANGDAEAGGATVVIEALNGYESPRYPLLSAAAAVAVADKVQAASGLDNVAFLADLYHLGRMGEDLAAVLARYSGRIGHVQIADVPGRGAPGTGQTGFEPLFGQLAGSGYQGRVGLEYKPTDPADSSSSFGWLAGPRG